MRGYLDNDIQLKTEGDKVITYRTLLLLDENEKLFVKSGESDANGNFIEVRDKDLAKDVLATLALRGCVVEIEQGSQFSNFTPEEVAVLTTEFNYTKKETDVINSGSSEAS